MSFLKRWFGGGNAEKPVAEVEHEGYTILVTPQADGGQWRLAATIRKQVGGEVRHYRLIRADVFPSPQDAVETTLRKAKLVIAEQGERMFG
jgi:hypothetical protein